MLIPVNHPPEAETVRRPTLLRTARKDTFPHTYILLICFAPGFKVDDLRSQGPGENQEGRYGETKEALK